MAYYRLQGAVRTRLSQLKFPWWRAERQREELAAVVSKMNNRQRFRREYLCLVKQLPAIIAREVEGRVRKRFEMIQKPSSKCKTEHLSAREMMVVHSGAIRLEASVRRWKAQIDMFSAFAAAHDIISSFLLQESRRLAGRLRQTPEQVAADLITKHSHGYMFSLSRSSATTLQAHVRSSYHHTTFSHFKHVMVRCQAMRKENVYAKKASSVSVLSVRISTCLPSSERLEKVEESLLGHTKFLQLLTAEFMWSLQQDNELAGILQHLSRHLISPNELVVHMSDVFISSFLSRLLFSRRETLSDPSRWHFLLVLRSHLSRGPREVDRFLSNLTQDNLGDITGSLSSPAVVEQFSESLKLVLRILTVCLRKSPDLSTLVEQEKDALTSLARILKSENASGATPNSPMREEEELSCQACSCHPCSLEAMQLLEALHIFNRVIAQVSQDHVDIVKSLTRKMTCPSFQCRSAAIRVLAALVRCYGAVKRLVQKSPRLLRSVLNALANTNNEEHMEKIGKFVVYSFSDFPSFICSSYKRELEEYKNVSSHDMPVKDQSSHRHLHSMHDAHSNRSPRRSSIRDRSVKEGKAGTVEAGPDDGARDGGGTRPSTAFSAWTKSSGEEEEEEEILSLMLKKPQKLDPLSFSVKVELNNSTRIRAEAGGGEGREEGNEGGGGDLVHGLSLREVLSLRYQVLSMFQLHVPGAMRQLLKILREKLKRKSAGYRQVKETYWMLEAAVTLVKGMAAFVVSDVHHRDDLFGPNWYDVEEVEGLVEAGAQLEEEARRRVGTWTAYERGRMVVVERVSCSSIFLAIFLLHVDDKFGRWMVRAQLNNLSDLLHRGDDEMRFLAVRCLHEITKRYRTSIQPSYISAVVMQAAKFVTDDTRVERSLTMFRDSIRRDEGCSHNLKKINLSELIVRIKIDELEETLSAAHSCETKVAPPLDCSPRRSLPPPPFQQLPPRCGDFKRAGRHVSMRLCRQDNVTRGPLSHSPALVDVQVTASCAKGMPQVERWAVSNVMCQLRGSDQHTDTCRSMEPVWLQNNQLHQQVNDYKAAVMLDLVHAGSSNQVTIGSVLLPVHQLHAAVARRKTTGFVVTGRRGKTAGGDYIAVSSKTEVVMERWFEIDKEGNQVSGYFGRFTGFGQGGEIVGMKKCQSEIFLKIKYLLHIQVADVVERSLWIAIFLVEGFLLSDESGRRLAGSKLLTSALKHSGSTHFTCCWKLPTGTISISFLPSSLNRISCKSFPGPLQPCSSSPYPPDRRSLLALLSQHVSSNKFASSHELQDLSVKGENLLAALKLAWKKVPMATKMRFNVDTCKTPDALLYAPDGLRGKMRAGEEENGSDGGSRGAMDELDVEQLHMSWRFCSFGQLTVTTWTDAWLFANAIVGDIFDEKEQEEINPNRSSHLLLSLDLGRVGTSKEEQEEEGASALSPASSAYLVSDVSRASTIKELLARVKGAGGAGAGGLLTGRKKLRKKVTKTKKTMAKTIQFSETPSSPSRFKTSKPKTAV
ncbi:hypothetical protein GUITHDRAFT_135958 [Guillardia theta CCMP2712]|uniref:Uncharacterized protein n=1 Tax=Guillardia theta (strain CCMP2712) TaxID=905079 RepID=L1JL72_GUITC|nr:hypothetical protein GUITHDRAFT_135958 [Guillardia theta CCMP2712]EKX49253.1 hypothetical protein GUITHDRAFT_135958 [Guillardia theta CCMP2712]|eukprot:XP_005836233.1 hypothetical protein GUITHDRAFT_135958 [Guillardia theta CCMP2712]